MAGKSEFLWVLTYDFMEQGCSNAVASETAGGQVVSIPNPTLHGFRDGQHLINEAFRFVTEYCPGSLAVGNRKQWAAATRGLGGLVIQEVTLHGAGGYGA
jgi:hypothetical protein